MLRIGYGGGLKAFSPGKKNSKSRFKKFAADWFWSYSVENIDSSTRSGYFLLKGVQKFKQKYPKDSEQLRIELWGLIDEGNIKQAEEMSIDDIVSIQGYVNRAESREKLHQCDVLFLPLETAISTPGPLFIPGKLFEYLSVGKPILALAKEPADCVDILRKSGLGIICSPFDSEYLANTLSNLVKNKYRLSELYTPDKSYIKSNFSFERLTKKMSNIFDELIT